MSYLIGILAGMCLPMQTSINTRLRRSVGSPFKASLISFIVGFLFLALLLLATGQGLGLPWFDLSAEPAWIWIGGAFGVFFLTGNILLFPKLGGVETVLLPILGQILMGLFVDHFGLFYAKEASLTAFRVMGAALVFAGVAAVSATKKAAPDEGSETPGKSLWPWRMLGVAGGMLSAAQTAINGHLGVVIGSPLKASAISFAVGVLTLAIICTAIKLRKGSLLEKGAEGGFTRGPWWMWVGGALGGIFVLGNIYLAKIIGVGMTVIVALIGTAGGGVLVDRFGLFEARRKAVTLRKAAGIAVMIAGAAMIKLL